MGEYVTLATERMELVVRLTNENVEKSKRTGENALEVALRHDTTQLPHAPSPAFSLALLLLMKPLVSPPPSPPPPSPSFQYYRPGCCTRILDCLGSDEWWLSLCAILCSLMLFGGLMMSLMFGLEWRDAAKEVATLKQELNDTTAQRQVTQWMAAFAASSSVSLVLDTKAEVLNASHVVGVLWPSHHKSNPWQVNGDLTAYNWFSGPTQQHVALRSGSGYRWTTNAVGTEKIQTSSCLTGLDVPDVSQLEQMNKTATIWAPTDKTTTARDNTTIALRVAYDGEPYKISALRDGDPPYGPTIIWVESASMVMQLSLMHNERDRSGSELGSSPDWPTCSQLFASTPSSAND